MLYSLLILNFHFLRDIKDKDVQMVEHQLMNTIDKIIDKKKEIALFEQKYRQQRENSPQQVRYFIICENFIFFNHHSQ